jgi:hypothetical protein
LLFTNESGPETSALLVFATHDGGNKWDIIIEDSYEGNLKWKINKTNNSSIWEVAYKNTIWQSQDKIGWKEDTHEDNAKDIKIISFEYFFRGFISLEGNEYDTYPRGSYIIETDEDWHDFKVNKKYSNEEVTNIYHKSDVINNKYVIIS